MATETEISYLAGIIDGEGFIGIHSCTKRKNKSSFYQVRVGVINTNRELLDWIKLKFGGSVCSRGKPTNPEKHRQCYQWRVEAKKAGELIRLVLPYLIIKTEQAKIVLEYRDTFEKMKPLIYFHKKGRFYNTIINPMTLPIREKLRNKILELNKRGPREKVYA